MHGRRRRSRRLPWRIWCQLGQFTADLVQGISRLVRGTGEGELFHFSWAAGKRLEGDGASAKFQGRVGLSSHAIMYLDNEGPHLSVCQ